MPTSLVLDERLTDFCAEFRDDPLRWVRGAFQWGEAGGPLVAFKEPLAWQSEFLEWLGGEIRSRRFDGIHPVMPIRGAVSSGHGIGKGALSGMLTAFIMSTRRDAKGVVTANTNSQLQDKTWAGIQTWVQRAITAEWFELNTSIMFRKGYRASWKCSPQTCATENSEAFAGQHNVKSTSFYINDEDSNVPEAIHIVQEGGLTDGEPMYFLFGNPTRSVGSFYQAVFGAQRNRWKTWVIDSRNVEITNKDQIKEWVQDYGEDSDFVRVRVRGLPPAASDLQYIAQDLVSAAQTRRDAAAFADEPLVCGLDVARGGSDRCVFWFRRGPDAYSLQPLRIPGEQARDSMRLVTAAADLLGRDTPKIHTLFVDETGIGGPIVDRLRQLGYRNVVGVQFGAKAPDVKYANMRAWMWGQMRDWLARGMIPTDARLEQDLTGPGYAHDKQDRIVLEPKEHMKARGLDSPDDGDALALTFAARVVKKPAVQVQPQPIMGGERDLSWMTY
jgi:hypothetical protein